VLNPRTTPPSRDPGPSDSNPPPPPPPAEDAEARFDALFHAHYNPLRHFAYRFLRSWEEAEDVVHDVFVRLWARRAELPTISDPSSYLYTAARNRALSRLEHLGHEARWRSAESARRDDAVDEGMTPERSLARREIAAAVQRALDQLTPRQREAILLQWRGRSYDQIAAELGISPKTVSVHLSRAFESLRQLLSSLRS
jgi:RNA polymerase sigma-70 factor (family 1)